MTDPAQPPTPSIDLALRRQALHAAVSGARLSAPLLWLTVLVALLPAWRLGTPPLAWVVAGMALLSGAWRLWFMHRLARPDSLTDSHLGSAERQIQVNAAMSGVMWAVLTLGFYGQLLPEERVLHMAVLAGSLATAAFYTSLIGRSFEWIALPMMLPLVAMSALHPQVRSWPLALCAVAFLLAMLRAAADHRRTTLQALRLGLEATAANRALQAAKERAEAEAAAKARFLATMSHEIRTPMNGAMNALDLLGTEPLSALQSRWLAVARHATASLMATLNEVLEHSSIEAGQVQPVPAPLALRQLGQDLVAELQAEAEARGLALHWHVDTHLPDWVLADRRCLHLVLQNLLVNALKFTERGQVSLRITLQPGAPQTVSFEVSDSGIGILAADLPRLFQPFQQLDNGPQRSRPGTGLGLVIAQRLVALMGGHISVVSELGRGSIFSFTLPLPTHVAPAPAVLPQAEAAAAPLRGMVLVAEDDPINRMVAVQVLKRAGLQVCEAADGEQALEALQRGGVSLVLMDGQMPMLDGYAATRQWRERESRLGTTRLPIIALSANALPEDVRLAMASGMDDHLAKPYGPQDLVNTVSRWLPAGT
jgi:signal transduction histidine kinase/CheY-like chemotaxis protein